MPRYTIIIRNPNGKPIEGEVEAESIENAIRVARLNGNDIDEAATEKRAAEAADRSGARAGVLGVLLGAFAWVDVTFFVGAIVLAAVALELSRGRRGFVAIWVGVVVFLIALFVRLERTGNLTRF